MRPLSEQALLRVWEQGERQHLLDRALTMLAAALPGTGRAALAELPVGQRDAGLLALYERTFAGKLHAATSCPRCHEQLEFAMTPAEMRAEASVPGPTQEVEAAGIVVRFRLPCSHDLAAVAGCAGVAQARLALARRCVSEASRDGAAVPAEELPAEVIGALAERMSVCDPQAEVLVHLTCPSCQHRWPVLFDIVTFFWAQIAATARRLLREVHALAQAYGWTEHEILSLSATRRRQYLDLVGA